MEEDRKIGLGLAQNLLYEFAVFYKASDFGAVSNVVLLKIPELVKIDALVF